MVEVGKVLDAVYLGNTLWQWSIAASVVIGVFVVLLLLRRLIRAKYRKLEATPETELMEVPFKVASTTTAVFLLVAAVFAGLQTVELPARISKFLLTVFTVSAFWQTGLWATTAVL